MRAAGANYDEIADRLAASGLPRTRSRRLASTIWLPEVVAAYLEQAAKVADVPFISLLQLGAKLLHEAPSWPGDHPRDIREYLDFKGLAETEKTWLTWAIVAADYVFVLVGIRRGELPLPNNFGANLLLRTRRGVSHSDWERRPHVYGAYLLFRAIDSGQVPPEDLPRVGVERKEIVDRDGIVVGQLTVFSERVRVFKPSTEFALDGAACERVAADLRAVLITAEGHDFNRHGAAQSLGRLADWIRSNHGSSPPNDTRRNNQDGKSKEG